MSKYQTRVNQVEAAKLDASTEYTDPSGVVVPGGSYLVRKADGQVTAIDAATFEADYELTPTYEPPSAATPDLASSDIAGAAAATGGTT